MESTDRIKAGIRFDSKSLQFFCFILIIEVLIALFINDRFIRPYGGDILVVIMMYYFVKSFIQTKHTYIIIGILLFAYAVEIGQYFNLVEILDMKNNKIMRIVIGSSFSRGDMLAYTLGAVLCYFIDIKEK